MPQGESHVSRDPILMLGNSICPMSHFAERSHKSKKKNNNNSSYCELGPPVTGLMLPVPAAVTCDTFYHHKLHTKGPFTWKEDGPSARVILEVSFNFSFGLHARSS